MDALTICQPYAHLVALDQKPVENRTWPTTRRGELAIHAGKSRAWLGVDDEERYPEMAFGAIVAIATLADCVHINDLRRRATELGGSMAAHRWFALYDHQHTHGPWCFVLENVRRVRTPVPCGGQRGIWPVPDAVAARVRQEAA